MGYKNLHEIEWDEEKIKDFWDYASSNKFRNKEYFSKEVGKSIIRLALKFDKLDGNILDYGCGPGHLLSYLLGKKISCMGADSSEESLEMVEKKFKDDRLFKGTVPAKNFPLAIADESVDFLFFVETLEHILPRQMPQIFDELKRILRKGGKIMITVPNRENLDKHKHVCPECGCSFHRMQHVNSFNGESLIKLLADYGFRKVFCDGILLTDNKFLKVKLGFKNILGIKYRKPHLIYIGEKL